MSEALAPFRLAMRREGNWWVAYLALRNTMAGAKELGRVLIGIVENNPERKTAFMDLMKSAIASATVDVLGKAPEYWEEQSAPESERSGRA